MSAQHSETYGVTKEDVRKVQSQTSAATGGDVPRTSNAAMLQVITNTHILIPIGIALLVLISPIESLLTQYL